MSNVWVTSDTHFGHKNIMKYSGREFESVEDMNEYIITVWNTMIAPEDTVYHLGDVCFRGHPRNFFSQLNGTIHVIHGNHDSRSQLRRCVEEGWIAWAKDTYYLRYGEHRFFLSHYPHIYWQNSDHGCMHLYGHTHGDLPFGNGRSMDVGVDTNSLFPYNLDDVVSILEALPAEANHHFPRVV